MIKHFKFLLLVVTLGFLGACTQVYVKQVQYADVDPVPEDAHPAPLRFSKISYLLPPGTEVGLESGMWGNWCWGLQSPVGRRAIGGYPVKFVKQTFSDALEANGYDVVENIDIDFRPEDELQRAEYFVSARVKDVDLDTCSDSKGGSAKGKFYMRVDWSVYDALRRTVVYKTTTEGYTNRKILNTEGLDIFFFDAFDMAAHNLAADRDFRALIVEGKKPPPHWRKDAPFGERFKDKPRMFDPLEQVVLENKPLSRQPFNKHAERSRMVAVTLQKVGHSSGFFISDAGHILTNQHVVGDARRMRVISADKKRTFIAEVLRVNKVRDVALLKLEEVPDNFKIVILPIRMGRAKISEDVYALGTPKDARTLQNTVTKGIVSAHREYKDEGIRLPFIQADVDIHGGSSGGPLLDEKGNIIGMTVEGFFADPKEYSTGLNLFIPIEEALAALDISIAGQGTLQDTSRPIGRIPPAGEAEEVFD